MGRTKTEKYKAKRKAKKKEKRIEPVFPESS